MSLFPFPIDAEGVTNDGLVWHRWAFFVFSFFSHVPKKLQLDPFGFWYFNFSPYSFNV
jgi:hypothetical protein